MIFIRTDAAEIILVMLLKNSPRFLQTNHTCSVSKPDMVSRMDLNRKFTLSVALMRKQFNASQSFISCVFPARVVQCFLSVLLSLFAIVTFENLSLN